WAVTVNPVPDITGTESVCAGSATTLSSTYTGGTWTGVAAAATVDPVYGIVTGVFNDTETIVYTLPTGCFSTAIITVNNAPDAITGPATVCMGATLTLTDDTLWG